MVWSKLVLLPGLLFLVGAQLACDRSPTSPTPTVAGTYTLVSARGQSLPAVVSGSPGTAFLQEVTGGFAELRADQTFAWRTEYRYTNNGQVTTSVSSGGGRYSLTGAAIAFTFEPSSEQLTGTLSDGVLTIRADVELFYRK